MAHEGGGLSPQTVALTTRIEAGLADIRETFDGASPDALLFIGDRHPVIPAKVILDPVLEPVDKLVWVILMMHVHKTGGCSALPDHETLASQANVSSTPVIVQAIAILRLLRWLTCCTSVQSGSEWFAGSIHVLHSKPLTLIDTCHLDRHYMHFVNESCAHGDARVRNLAKAVLDSLDATVNVSKGGDTARQYAIMEKEKGGSVCSSSDFTTTTTTTTTGNSDTACRGFPGTDLSSGSLCALPLIYPPRLTDRQRILANRYLAAVDPPDRQALLDELQGRFESEQKGMRPIYDELRFLHALCRAQRQGRFVANLGIRVMEAREVRMQSTAPVIDEAQKAQARKERERARALGRKQIARLRRKLGMKDRTG